jgi:uncharacterized glyoxalase superfamily protein PhnB
MVPYIERPGADPNKERSRTGIPVVARQNPSRYRCVQYQTGKRDGSTMADKTARSGLISCLGYKDADAAVSWLVRAFGFEEHAVYRNAEGKVVHAEVTFGGGMIMIGPDGGGEFGKAVMTMPERADGRCTQTIYGVVEDVDAHYKRAAAAGAVTIIAPRGESYGGRSYSVRDPEGHAWSFGSYDPWAVAEKG